MNPIHELVFLVDVDDTLLENDRIQDDLTRKSVEDSPEFDPSKGVNRDYEAYLYDHYGRPINRDGKARCLSRRCLRQKI